MSDLSRSDASDLRREIADEAEKVWDAKLVQEVLTEFAGNMGFERKGLPEYGLMKIVNYVASVAHAQARGLDPEVLRMSPEEAEAAILKRARAMVAASKPVLRVDDHGVTRMD